MKGLRMSVTAYDGMDGSGVIGARASLVVIVVTFAVAILGVFIGGGLALGAQSPAVACPNEALREEQGAEWLAECRAYEMVTPTYKEGFELFPVSFASNGDSAIIKTFADLAGSSGSGEFAVNSNYYVTERTGPGWRLMPLNAPDSRFVGQLLEGSEAQSGYTLWIQHEPSLSASFGELYVRDPAGEYHRVGPDKPNEGYEEEPSNAIDLEPSRFAKPIAATPDFAHIVLGAFQREGRWEFDETSGEPFRSLYEYSGTGNERPVLVGVGGAGGEQKGSTQLLGKCGVVLGSEASTYNALADGGERIFFTVRPCSPGPATAELYAREHGALTSPVAARTVDVSASECVTGCGVESGKNFEGASEDGSRVFFTSSQKLTGQAIDRTAVGDATEGACAPLTTGGCNLYEYSFATSRLKGISEGAEVLGVVAIAEDGSRVYYVSRAAIPSAGSNVFGRAPVGGEPNLYVYDTGSGRTVFVATLARGDSEDWRRQFARPAEAAGVSGRFLLFASVEPGLTPDDSSTREQLEQLFEYKAGGEGEAAELVRVSKGEDGYNEDGNGVTVGVEPGAISGFAESLGRGSDFKQGTNRLNVSVDGRTVVFATGGQLSSRAVSAGQGCRSVYEFHTPTSVLSEGELSLVSDGRDVQSPRAGAPCGAGFVGMDGSGANILFHTADPLLQSDVDGFEPDVYDARVDGGFPTPAGGVGCASSVCAGPGGVSAPVVSAPGSSTVAPEGSLPPVTGEPGKGKQKKGSGKAGRATRSCKKRSGARHRGKTCKKHAARRRAAGKGRGA